MKKFSNSTLTTNIELVDLNNAPKWVINIYEWARKYSIPDNLLLVREDNLLNLRRLELENLSIDYIIPDICRLHNLISISFFNNNLENIPESIFELIGLKYLVLERNKISKVSTSISKLKNLIELDLGENSLTNLPNEIINLKKLRILNLQNNKIIFTNEQINWIKELEKNGCEIYIDSVSQNTTEKKTLDKTGDKIMCLFFSSHILDYTLLKTFFKKLNKNFLLEDFFSYERLEDYKFSSNFYDNSNIYYFIYNCMNYTKELNPLISYSMKVEIIEVLFSMINVKKRIQENDILLIQTISNEFNVENEQFRSIRDKIISVNKYDFNLQYETFIGLKNIMKDKEKLEFLKKEYTKWNSRVSNSDPAIREQAEEMIKIISELRTKYK